MVTTMECLTITITTIRGHINLATTTLLATTLASTTLDTTTLHTTTPTGSATGEATPIIMMAVRTDRITLDITQDITTIQDILTEIIQDIVDTIQVLTRIIPATRNTIPTVLLTMTDITIQDIIRVDCTTVLVPTAEVMLQE
jgi:hypothetical protein